MNACVVSAVEHIRRMRGGSQAHLMRASDGNYYVVKFKNSPQGVRVLANELFATRLAHSLGLPMADVCIIEVPGALINERPGLRIETSGSFTRCAAGLQLGSRFAADLERDRIFEYLPSRMFNSITNRDDFVRVLAFDK